jgi:hypothetical protein
VSAYVTRAMRDRARDRVYAEQVCECGHLRMQHLELPSETYTLEDGVIVATPNPAYRPLHFHCRTEGCDCVRVVGL